MSRSRSIAGMLDLQALSALAGYDARAQQHRPDGDTLRCAAAELRSRGLMHRDIADALGLSETAVRQLLQAAP